MCKKCKINLAIAISKCQYLCGECITPYKKSGRKRLYNLNNIKLQKLLNHHPKPKPIVKLKCKECKKIFIKNDRRQIYCSPKCRKYYNNRQCLLKYHKRLHNLNNIKTQNE